MLHMVIDKVQDSHDLVEDQLAKLQNVRFSITLFTQEYHGINRRSYGLEQSTLNYRKIVYKVYDMEKQSETKNASQTG